MKRLPALLLMLVVGCAASSQKPAIDTALENDELRAESLEATLRVFDEHPEYVDELFQMTLRHPRTLDRFLQNAAEDLKQDALARRTAKHLTAQPEGLRQILIATLDEATHDEAARDAVARAMAARPQAGAIAIVQRDDAILASMSALIDEVMKNARARRAFLQAMEENSPELARLLANNPDLLGKMAGELAKAGVSRGGKRLEAVKRALENGAK